MNTKHNPTTVATPLSAYSHGVEVGPDARWLYVSGQIAIDADGNTPDDIEAQTDLVFRNITEVLAGSSMTLSDLVRLNIYIVNPDDMAGFRKVRDRYVGDIRPASTMVAVAALAKPEFLIEIEAVAATAD